MPFGKHRGEDLEDIPDDYLIWVLDNLDSLSPTLKEAIRMRLGLMEKPRPPPGEPKPYPPPPRPASPPPPPPPPPVKGIAEDKLMGALKAWWRRIVMKHHPDRGGEHVVMAAMNDARELLQEFISDLLKKK